MQVLSQCPCRGRSDITFPWKGQHKLKILYSPHLCVSRFSPCEYVFICVTALTARPSAVIKAQINEGQISEGQSERTRRQGTMKVDLLVSSAGRARLNIFVFVRHRLNKFCKSSVQPVVCTWCTCLKRTVQEKFVGPQNIFGIWQKKQISSFLLKNWRRCWLILKHTKKGTKQIYMHLKWRHSAPINPSLLNPQDPKLTWKDGFYIFFFKAEMWTLGVCANACS